MNTEQTINKLNEMKLTGMSQSYQERRVMPDHKDLSFDEFFGLVSMMNSCTEKTNVSNGSCGGRSARYLPLVLKR